jgi:hypothetical protein
MSVIGRFYGKSVLVNHEKTVFYHFSFLPVVSVGFHCITFLTTFNTILYQFYWKHTFTSEIIHAPVAHTYNLSYSGNRDQEDWSLKPAWANHL